MASKKFSRDKTGRTTGRPLQWYQDPTIWIVVGVLAIAVAVAGFKLSHQNVPTANIDRAAIATAELSYPRMLEIERMFVCPCGNCGELELEVCTCDGLGGALEMKTTIARLLRSGSGVDQIVATVSAQYGGLKPQYVQADAPSEATIPIESGLEPRNDQLLQSARKKDVGQEDLFAVISAFDCPCGNCALTLSECTCDHDRGSVEVKTFVGAKLEAGLSPDEVIDQVDRSYGGRRYTNLRTVVTEDNLTE